MFACEELFFCLTGGYVVNTQNDNDDLTSEDRLHLIVPHLLKLLSSNEAEVPRLSVEQIVGNTFIYDVPYLEGVSASQNELVSISVLWLFWRIADGMYYIVAFEHFYVTRNVENDVVRVTPMQLTEEARFKELIMARCPCFPVNLVSKVHNAVLKDFRKLA